MNRESKVVEPFRADYINITITFWRQIFGARAIGTTLEPRRCSAMLGHARSHVLRLVIEQLSLMTDRSCHSLLSIRRRFAKLVELIAFN